MPNHLLLKGLVIWLNLRNFIFEWIELQFVSDLSPFASWHNYDTKDGKIVIMKSKCPCCSVAQVSIRNTGSMCQFTAYISLVVKERSKIVFNILDKQFQNIVCIKVQGLSNGNVLWHFSDNCYATLLSDSKLASPTCIWYQILN